MKIQVETEVSVADMAQHMSEGERQHMANHLYKHYDVAPQKLRSVQEERAEHSEGVVPVRTLKNSLKMFEELAAYAEGELQFHPEPSEMESWYRGRHKAYALAADHINNLIEIFSTEA